MDSGKEEEKEEEGKEAVTACGYKRGTLKQLVVATLPPFESLLPMLSFCHTGENSQRCALHNYVTILKPPSNVQCPLLVIIGLKNNDGQCTTLSGTKAHYKMPFGWFAKRNVSSIALNSVQGS